MYIFCFCRLPAQKNDVDPTVVGEAFLVHLENKRENETGIKIRKKKKMQVPAGKGITPDDIVMENGDAVDEPGTSSSTPAPHRRGRPTCCTLFCIHTTSLWWTAKMSSSGGGGT